MFFTKSLKNIEEFKSVFIPIPFVKYPFFVSSSKKHRIKIAKYLALLVRNYFYVK